MTVRLVDVARVATLLPSAASTDYGWDSDYITNLMETNGLGVYKSVREFWLQRVNETAEYLDINGKPLTQIHEQAVEMLAYWDALILAGKDVINGQDVGGNITFGRIAGPTEGVCRRGRDD